MKRASTAGIALVCLLALGCGREGVTGTQEPSGVELVNYTGSALKGVYLSRTNSNTWQENILGNNFLREGTSMQIHLTPEDMTARWDLKIESTEDEKFAEWKNLDLREAARITLLQKIINEPVMLANVELRKTN